MKNDTKNKISKLVFTTAIVLVMFQLSLEAQSLSDNNRKGALSNQLFDTRSLSMASTTISDVYGRPSIGINPAIAGLSILPGYLQVNSNHNWENELVVHSLSMPSISFGHHHFNTRLALAHREWDNLPFAGSINGPEPDLMMYRADLAYAVSFSTYFSLGILQSLSYSTSNRVSHFWNYSIDLGLVYAPDGPVSYAAVLRGLGNETTYEIIETGLTTLGTQQGQQILELGASFRFPIEERTYMSLSFSNEKKFGEDGLWYKGGLELVPIAGLNLRGGLLINFDQSKFMPRAGLGIQIGLFQLDYMIAPEKLTTEQFHQVGITIQL